MLEKLGLKDGESIDHPWINKAIERAQEKVEGRNFDIRKTLIKFDNVLNDQRQVIFEQRKQIIEANEELNYSKIFLNEVLENIRRLKLIHEKSPNANEFQNYLKQTLGKSVTNIEFDELIDSSANDIENFIKDKFNKNREERNKLLGTLQANDIEKRILVQIIDQNWKSHIQYLEQLRQVIGLRSYGQRDPLVEYKKEAFILFENLLSKLKNDLVTMLLNLKIIQKEDEDNSNEEIRKNLKSIAKSKIGRNDPCPCNSGKKYKHCCGAL
jgi:Preprotein translocase subunit SecA (ATPase, RNA helicase)